MPRPRVSLMGIIISLQPRLCLSTVFLYGIKFSKMYVDILDNMEKSNRNQSVTLSSRLPILSQRLLYSLGFQIENVMSFGQWSATFHTGSLL
ncbi:hypothetical protein J6590_065905 [Homalodisca vitripennis]|nr:hypothetical protein J6590_065905 [Homalodisca vitripennis]